MPAGFPMRSESEGMNCLPGLVHGRNYTDCRLDGCAAARSILVNSYSV